MLYLTYLYCFLLLLTFVGIYYIRMIKSRTLIPPYGNHKDLNTTKILSFLKEKGGNHLSHLILLQDKQIFWAQNERVLIAYRQIFNKLIVLGDPIGDSSLIQDSIKEFCDYADRKGLKPVFYQVSPQYMQYYHDCGFRSINVGEEGKVNLENYSLAGKKRAKLRSRFNILNREGFNFQVQHPPFSDSFLQELHLVSDSWLGKQKEKGFSVVSYSHEYVSHFPIATLTNPEGKIIAFSTLATDYNDSISIDLMRKTPDSPSGTMDVLFLHIFEWAKEHGFAYCSLGMSPLSNVGIDENCILGEKLLNIAYRRGNKVYNFKGLRDFKGKFACTWEPKYIVYRKTLVSITILQLILLINKQPIPKPKAVERLIYLLGLVKQ